MTQPSPRWTSALVLMLGVGVGAVMRSFDVPWLFCDVVVGGSTLTALIVGGFFRSEP